MDMQEFAERVVFGTTLEEKLTPPTRISTDLASGAEGKFTNLRAPSRPSGLEMRMGRSMGKAPSDRELENEQHRGRLLHYLANHELLATELMALVLLKFPNAPAAFRRGVLVTLQEEQEHTRLYLDRMRACGVEFGSFPLSGHFWRVVAPMSSPMDFVTRLSLTFEQANLDYSLHFAHQFRQVDDQETASILERIYQDEIGHVQHGLHWFRQWKQPDQSDWEAYQQALDFPMSPQRGRGPSCAFNREGRRQAGLNEQFINAIEVYRQSRGRPPTVRWFDAGAEATLGGPVTSKEAVLLDQLNRDLEAVMIPLAKSDDVQLVRGVPSVQHRQRLLQAGFELPEFVPFEQAASLGERILHRCDPWAWTPDAHQQADLLANSLQRQHAPWHERHREPFRKSWLATQAEAWLADAATPAWMHAATPALTVHSTQQVTAALNQLAKLGYRHVLFKADLATSGRQQRRLETTGLRDHDRRWLDAQWQRHPQGLIEPELDRLLDLSFQWDLSRSKNQFRGWTRPMVTAGRRYCGTRLHRPFDDCSEELKRFLLADDCKKLNITTAWLESFAIACLRQHGFAHRCGMDAFVHRYTDGTLRIHPCVELNPRCTMGHVALALRKYVAAATSAEFRVFTRDEWNSFASGYAAAALERSKDGRLQNGFIALTEVQERTKLVAALLVGEPARAMCAMHQMPDVSSRS